MRTLICFLIGVFLSAFLFEHNFGHTPTGRTVYVTTINKHKAYCDIAKREKGCMSLTSCEDGNSYFCVQNIEMKVDK